MNQEYDINCDLELIQNFMDSPNIRKEYSEGRVYYCLLDLITEATTTVDPKDYFKKLKIKDRRLMKDWDSLSILLRTQTKGGPQMLKFIDAQGFFRLVQIIPGETAHNIKNAFARIINSHFQG